MPDIDFTGLFFTLMAVPALVFSIYAFKIKKRMGRITPNSFIIIIGIIAYVLYGVFYLAKPQIWAALNPWLDAMFNVSILCLFFITVILCYFTSGIKKKFAVVVLLMMVITIQAFITPGVRIYYDNDPLDGNVYSIKPYDIYFAKLKDGQILYVENGFPFWSPEEDAVKAALIPTNSVNSKEFKIEMSRSISFNSQKYIKDKIINDYFINPFHISNRKFNIGKGVILPGDWQATGAMLYNVIGKESSFYHLKRIEELLKRGANPNYIKDQKDSIMSRAMLSRDIKAIKLLIEAGGDINLSNSDGNTPLNYALNIQHLNYRSYELIKFLIENGADLKRKNNKGQTPRGLFLDNFENRDSSKDSSTYNHPFRVKIKILIDNYK